MIVNTEAVPGHLTLEKVLLYSEQPNSRALTPQARLAIEQGRRVMLSAGLFAPGPEEVAHKLQSGRWEWLLVRQSATTPKRGVGVALYSIIEGAALIDFLAVYVLNTANVTKADVYHALMKEAEKRLEGGRIFIVSHNTNLADLLVEAGFTNIGPQEKGGIRSYRDSLSGYMLIKN